MIIELTKKGIRLLETALVFFLFAYYACCIYVSLRWISVASLLSLYPLVLSLYYYTSLIRDGHPVETGGVNSICPLCRSFKARSSSHCEFCSICVPERDHHCPLVSRCIHKKNSPAFMFFLLFLTLNFLMNIILTPVPEIFVFFSAFSASYIAWACYVWSQGQTTIGFLKNGRRRCSLLSLYRLLFEEDTDNIKVMFFPFLRVSAKVKR